MKLQLWSAALGSCAVAFVFLAGITSPADDPGAQARAEITKTAEAFVAAYHREDAKALSEFWTPEGDYMDLGGRVIKGREAIAADFAHLFAENDGLKLRIEVASVRFPTPDTAIEDGVTSVMSSGGGLPNRAHYTNFLVKQDGKWLLSSVRESAYVPPNNYDRLQQFEWAIGEWAEDVKEGHAGRVVFEWTPDQNFIIASRAVAVNDNILFNGSERIGWDPAAKLIRSWNFEADGGFSEGSWTRTGDNQWTIKTSAVLRSGSLMTSTTTISRTDPDTVTWQSKDQRLDGNPLPDTAVITMKRVH